MFDPYIKMLNAVPRVVLAPLFLLWFGLGIWSKVALAVTLVFFVMFFNTYQGVRDADRVLIDNVRMLGATSGSSSATCSMPSALTWIFSSLQTSLGFAMVGAVVGEYLGATRGLGYVISQAEGTFDTTGVFAGMTVLGVVVVIVSAGVTRLERWSAAMESMTYTEDTKDTRSDGCALCPLCPSCPCRAVRRRRARATGRRRRAPRADRGRRPEPDGLPADDARAGARVLPRRRARRRAAGFAGGAKALQALVGGSADVVSGFYDHTIQMAAEGREIVAFVTMLRFPGLVLVTSPQSGGDGDDDRGPEGTHRRRDDRRLVVADAADYCCSATASPVGRGQHHRDRQRGDGHCRASSTARSTPGWWRIRRSRWSAAQSRRARARRPAAPRTA